MIIRVNDVKLHIEKEIDTSTNIAALISVIDKLHFAVYY